MIPSILRAVLPPPDHSQQQHQLLHVLPSVTPQPAIPMRLKHHHPRHQPPATKASIADPTADPIVEGPNVPESRKADPFEVDIANTVGITTILAISKSVNHALSWRSASQPRRKSKLTSRKCSRRPNPAVDGQS